MTLGPIGPALAELVHESLAQHLVRNATFYAERLLASDPSSEQAKLLLAQCYMRSNNKHRCYQLLKGATSPACRYTFAVAAVSVGKLAEAERALAGSIGNSPQPQDASKADVAAALGHDRPTQTMQQPPPRWGEASGGGATPAAATAGGGGTGVNAVGGFGMHGKGEDETMIAGGAAGRYLMGEIHLRTGRTTTAIEHFCGALSLDPLMWCAYETLCQIGADEAVVEIVASVSGNVQQDAAAGAGSADPHFSPAMAMSTGGTTSHAQRQADDGDYEQPVPMITPGSAMMQQQQQQQQYYNRPSVTPMGADFTTPSPSSFMTPAQQGIVPVAQAPNRGGGGGGGGGASSTAVDTSINQSGDGCSRRRKFVDDGKMRKVSGRLFSGSSVRRSSRLASARLEGNEAGTSTPNQIHDDDDDDDEDDNGGVPAETTKLPGSGFIAPPSLNPPSSAAPLKPSMAQHYGGVGAGGDSAAELAQGGGADFSSKLGTSYGGGYEGTLRVWELIKVIIDGYRHLCSYRCHEALEVFNTLPREQYQTPWVLCQVGKAMCELVDYHAACEVFKKARRLAPWQLEGMEAYSTALWHLKREVELSYLAQEVVATDRLSPHAWCVVGNCFSLQKEHELALSYFQRALQLDSRFTYAHTLCGHEYFANEDFDKGLSCYRNAIAIDPLHYNAWYGLGTVYFRQEKYDLAEYHFRRALDINPRSSVLSCYLGMALHKLHRNLEALGLLQDAIVSDPKNPLAKFERACVLMSENHVSEALHELHELQQMAPKEATVYFQLGKAYKRLNRVDQAMIHFSMALDLKPSSADTNKIKAAIEGLHASPDESDEEEL